MTRSQTPIQALFDPQDLQRIRRPLNEGWTLPREAYTSAAVFDAEVERIFSQSWLPVAHISQLANAGDFICVDLPNQPVVVTRNSAGELKAFSRICLHRAMPIIEGSGNATRFTCPYHQWTYELDGRLRSAPMMEGAEGFEAGACQLPSLKVETWQGFVMVNLAQDAAPLATQLEGLRDHMAGYGIAGLEIAATLSFDSPWNWKILVENFMEAYHHIGTHKDTFEPVYPARDSTVPDNGDAPWSLLRMPGKPGSEDESLPPLPGLDASRLNELVAATVFPALLIAGNANMVFWYQMMPRAHDAMQLQIHVLMPAEVNAVLGAEDREAIAGSVRFIHEQDIEVNAGPWQGLHAQLTRQGRLSPWEKAIWQLNQLWADALGLP